MVKSFLNNLIISYLERVEVNNIFGAPYHPQSRGAIEVFNKIVQSALSFSYDNVKQKEIESDLELNLFYFLHYYNWVWKHTTTNEVPKFLWIILMIAQ